MDQNQKKKKLDIKFVVLFVIGSGLALFCLLKVIDKIMFFIKLLLTIDS